MWSCQAARSIHIGLPTTGPTLLRSKSTRGEGVWNEHLSENAISASTRCEMQPNLMKIYLHYQHGRNKKMQNLLLRRISVCIVCKLLPWTTRASEPILSDLHLRESWLVFGEPSSRLMSHPLSAAIVGDPKCHEPKIFELQRWLMTTCEVNQRSRER